MTFKLFNTQNKIIFTCRHFTNLKIQRSSFDTRKLSFTASLAYADKLPIRMLRQATSTSCNVNLANILLSAGEPNHG